MDKVQYKVEQCGEYYGLPAINITLERVTMENDDPLWERVNDTRTPFEQYDAGEEYIYVYLSDLIENSKPAIYSRSAYHNKFLNSQLPYYTKKNFKIKFEDWCKVVGAIDSITRDDIMAHIEQLNQDHEHFCDPYLMDYKEGLAWAGNNFVFKADLMGGAKHDL